MKINESKKKLYNSTLQILISKELKKKVQSTALNNDEKVSTVVRNLLENYVTNNK